MSKCSVAPYCDTMPLHGSRMVDSGCLLHQNKGAGLYIWVDGSWFKPCCRVEVSRSVNVHWTIICGGCLVFVMFVEILLPALGILEGNVPHWSIEPFCDQLLTVCVSYTLIALLAW